MSQQDLKHWDPLLRATTPQLLLYNAFMKVPET